jgi:hypothetical protein
MIMVCSNCAPGLPSCERNVQPSASSTASVARRQKRLDRDDQSASDTGEHIRELWSGTGAEAIEVLFADGVELGGGHARGHVGPHGVSCRGNRGTHALQTFYVTFVID